MPEKKSGDFCCKIYSQGDEILVAICDSELVGKEFREHGLRLFVDGAFYKDGLCSEEEARRLFKDATMLNLVGKRIIEIAVADGFIDAKNIITVQGIPHAQYARIK